MTLISEQQLPSIIKRLAHQILETYPGLENAVIVGLQPRGVFLSDKIVAALQKEIDPSLVQYGKLDITFFRDDIRRELHLGSETNLPFSIEGKTVILIDDVLYTGRTIRAAMDAMLGYGRPSSVELLVFVDRRFTRNLPIEATYVGRSVDSIDSQRVSVEWAKTEGEDKVLMFSTDKEK